MARASMENDRFRDGNLYIESLGRETCHVVMKGTRYQNDTVLLWSERAEEAKTDHLWGSVADVGRSVGQSARVRERNTHTHTQK